MSNEEDIKTIRSKEFITLCAKATEEFYGKKYTQIQYLTLQNSLLLKLILTLEERIEQLENK